MSKINLYDSILNPLVTEKSTNLSEMNKIVFRVNRSADKDCGSTEISGASTPVPDTDNTISGSLGSLL